MVDDVDVARRFAERELGPLAATDDATVRLASTLAVFLEEDASFVRASRPSASTPTRSPIARRAKGAPGAQGERVPVAARLACCRVTVFRRLRR